MVEKFNRMVEDEYLKLKASAKTYGELAAGIESLCRELRYKNCNLGNAVAAKMEEFLVKDTGNLLIR